VTLQAGDIRTFETPAGGLSHVVHAAVDAAPPVTEDDRRRVFDVIVEGTRRALACARASGASRFLFASSGAIYGTQPREVPYLTEDYRGGPDPANRDTAGAEAKRAAETLCAVHASDAFQPTIARCFTFVGPYLPLDGKFAAGNFIRDAIGGGPIVVAGDGTPCRSYLYASDLAAWLWVILLRGEAARPYNVGSEAVTTIGDLARTVAARFSPPLEVRIEGRKARGVAGDRYVPSTSRVRAELGVAMTVGLEDAIARTVEWHAAR
jgi:dTDP-glucose 4,6-dehydratase